MIEQNIIKQVYQKVKLIIKTSKKQIWLAKNILTKQLLIMKTQSSYQSSKKKSNRNIMHEAKYMQNLQGYIGIPALIWAGKQQQSNSMIIITQRLGKTLQQLYTKQKKILGLKQVCCLGIKLFNIICCIHSKGYAHGNLNLNVIQFGVGSNINEIYLNDMMDCVTFLRNSKFIKRQYIKNKMKINQFMSFDRVQGFEARPRDDIISIIYILIFILKGQLPWTKAFMKIQAKQMYLEFEQDTQLNDSLNKNSKDFKQLTKDETIIKFNKFNGEPHKYPNAPFKIFNNLKTIIQSITIDQISQGLDIQFNKMLGRSRQLKYQQKPDYNYFIRCLKKILYKHGYEQQSYLNGLASENVLKKQQFKDLRLKLINQQRILLDCYNPFEKDIDLN